MCIFTYLLIWHSTQPPLFGACTTTTTNLAAAASIYKILDVLGGEITKDRLRERYILTSLTHEGSKRETLQQQAHDQSAAREVVQAQQQAHDQSAAREVVQAQLGKKSKRTKTTSLTGRTQTASAGGNSTKKKKKRKKEPQQEVLPEVVAAPSHPDFSTSEIAAVTPHGNVSNCFLSC